MPKAKVLFVCIHNSTRNRMAEAFLNHMAGDLFEATSAGIEKGMLNPLSAEVMKEVGIDISGKQTNDVFDFCWSGFRINSHIRSNRLYFVSQHTL